MRTLILNFIGSFQMVLACWVLLCFFPGTMKAVFDNGVVVTC